MRRYWQSESRYYSVHMTQDLWGDWMLIRCWGGRFNARGQAKTIVVKSYDAGIGLMAEIAKTRQKRGYQEIQRNG